MEELTSGSGRFKPHAYFDDLSRQNWITWICSGVVAVGLNLAIFLLLPHLMDMAPANLEVETLIPRVNIVQIRPRRAEKKDKVIKPPEKPRQLPRKRPPATPRPISAKLQLPFALNPRLPEAPGTLALPPLSSTLLTDFSVPSDTFSVGQLDAPLTTLVRMPPVYPLRARRRGVEGWVKVGFVIDEAGRVSRVAILEAQPVGIFEESVKRCVKGWRFKPGTVDGMAVKTEVETTIRFTLDGRVGGRFK